MQRIKLIMFGISALLVSVILPFYSVALTGDNDNSSVIYKHETDFTVAYSSYDSNFSDGSFNYYSQLDKNQQAIYNGLKNITPSSEKMNIKIPTPVTYTAKSSNPTEAEKKPSGTEMLRLAQGALDALIMDYPEIFWIDINKFVFKWSAEGTQKGSGYLFTISGISFSFGLIDSYIPIKDQMVNTLMSKVNGIPVTGSSRYSKVLSIHDELAKRISYDTDFSSVRAHDAYGALVDQEAVCDGYAEAFKLICDKYNIPCVLVVGTGITSSVNGPHMWNAVQMEDGKWYGVDVTWDDHTESPNSYIYKDYFLVGSNTIAKNIDKQKFSNSHLASGYFTNSEISKEFSYPPLAFNAYVPGSGITVTTKPIPSGTVVLPSPPKTKADSTASIMATTKPSANIKTTSQGKTSPKNTEKSTTASAGQTEGLYNKTTTMTMDTNETNSDFDKQSKSGKNNVSDASTFNIILIAPYIVAGVTALAIIILIVIFVLAIKTKWR
ncbi:MAG: transglutaminase domain-containing protein [Oscillospiraceae bacterium]|nr:transglutaminase domain-containing protein [Oscillospiraceae bacterium]